MSDPRVGWVSTTLSELVGLRTGPFGSALHQSDYVSGGTPLVNPMHIINGRITPSPDMSVSAEMAERLIDFRLRLGDVVLGRRGEMGRCAVVGSREEGWLCGTGSLIVRPNPQMLSSDYLQRLLTSRGVVDYLLAASVGSTMANLNQQHLLALEVQLPPLTEQTRIVEKLEELLSDLYAGVAELKAAQKKLQQYRQSLLKAAVEGSLTAAWREANPIPEESGADLLARILRERRGRWEAQQIGRFEAQGKAAPKGWQEKYVEPAAPDAAGLPDLPAGWVWCSIDQLANVGTGVTPLRSNSAYFDGGSVPWVTSGALNAEVVTQATEMVTEQALRECRLEVYSPGSLLVAMYGEGKTRGKCAELGLAATINQAIAAIVLLPSALACKAFVKTVLLDSYEAMRAKASGGVQPNLNLQIVKSLAVPLPPLVEQAEIALALAEQLASMQELAESLAALQRQSTAQRQNLHRAAFAGQLVPQNPAEEPAADLLARIRAERAGGGSIRPTRGRKPKAVA